MGNDGDINKKYEGFFLSWKGNRHCLGLGEELEVKKKRESCIIKGIYHTSVDI